MNRSLNNLSSSSFQDNWQWINAYIAHIENKQHMETIA